MRLADGKTARDADGPPAVAQPNGVYAMLAYLPNLKRPRYRDGDARAEPAEGALHDELPLSAQNPHRRPGLPGRSCFRRHMFLRETRDAHLRMSIERCNLAARPRGGRQYKQR